MLVDSAMMLLLSSGAAPQPAMRANMPHMDMAAPNMPAVNQQHLAQALLMSPLPVLTHVMRQTIQQTAQAAADGASSLLELAQDDDVMMGEAEQDPSMGSTAMVGAAAAALALLNMRRPAPRY